MKKLIFSSNQAIKACKEFNTDYLLDDHDYLLFNVYNGKEVFKSDWNALIYGKASYYLIHNNKMVVIPREFCIEIEV